MDKIKQNKRKKVCVFACVGVLAAMPFVLGNTPVESDTFDLTGTSWVFNENLSYSGLDTEGKVVFDVNFTSGSQFFNSFTLWYDYYGHGGYQLSYYKDDDLIVYDSVDSEPWSDSAYKTIYIKSVIQEGQEAELIAFLQSNATLVVDSTSENLDLFNQIYDILNSYLFDGQIVQDDMSYKNLMLIAGSSVLSFFIIAIPFIAVFSVIRLFFR